MYVYLKESELNRKLFINKSYKQGTIKLLFSRETPFHEVKDESVIAFLLKSFPNFLEKSKEIPSFLNKKEKKESPAAPLVKPEPKKEVVKPEQPKAEPKEEMGFVSSVISNKKKEEDKEDVKKSEDPMSPSQILSDLLKKKDQESK